MPAPTKATLLTENAALRQLILALEAQLAARSPADANSQSTQAGTERDDPLIESFLHRSSEGQPPDPYNNLTGRERQVLQMAAQGSNNPEIAALRAISVRTVEMHRANLLRKLGLKGQSELVRYAVKRGLVE